MTRTPEDPRKLLIYKKAEPYPRCNHKDWVSFHLAGVMNHREDE